MTIPVTINSITLLKKGLWKVFNVILLLLLLFTKYSQLSPCGHLAITDTPLTRTALLTPVSVISLIIRDGPLENLLGGEGGEEPKKYSRQGKLNEKKYIHARQLTLKIFMLWPKKNSYKEFDNEKTIPPP